MKKDIINNKKEEILNSALICFNKKGFYKTSIDEIASRIGVTKGTIYWYYRSKKALFIEVFNLKVKKYFYGLLADFENNYAPDEKIVELLEKSSDNLNESLPRYRFALEFITVGTRDPDIKQEVTLFYNERIEIYKNIFSKGIKAGKFKNIDPEAISWHLNFLSIGMFLIYFTSDLFFDPITQHRVNLKIFFDGIR